MIIMDKKYVFFGIIIIIVVLAFLIYSNNNSTNQSSIIQNSTSISLNSSLNNNSIKITNITYYFYIENPFYINNKLAYTDYLNGIRNITVKVRNPRNISLNNTNSNKTYNLTMPLPNLFYLAYTVNSNNTFQSSINSTYDYSFYISPKPNYSISSVTSNTTGIKVISVFPTLPAKSSIGILNMKTQLKMPGSPYSGKLVIFINESYVNYS